MIIPLHRSATRRSRAHQPLGTFIQLETAERAAKFLHDYLLKHAIAFYCGVLDMGDHHRRITAVAGYILAHKLERVTNRDIQRGVKTLRDLARRETEIIFEHLEAFGWVTRTPAPRPVDPPHWIVNHRSTPCSQTGRKRSSNGEPRQCKC